MYCPNCEVTFPAHHIGKITVAGKSCVIICPACLAGFVLSYPSTIEDLLLYEELRAKFNSPPLAEFLTKCLEEYEPRVKKSAQNIARLLPTLDKTDTEKDINRIIGDLEFVAKCKKLFELEPALFFRFLDNLMRRW